MSAPAARITAEGIAAEDITAEDITAVWEIAWAAAQHRARGGKRRRVGTGC